MNKDNSKIKNLVESCQAGFSLPQAFYNDPDVYQADLDEIYYKKWIYAGHTSQIPQIGEYFLLEFAQESIIICRSKDDEIKAFANVCRHRGSRVCLQNKGKTSTFVCPYHAWTYDLDGQLRSKRSMPEGFDRSQYGLKPIRLSVFQGLIFVNLDADASDFSNAISGLSNAFDIYQLENTKVAHQQTFNVEANWKLAIENFTECYHCTPAHPEYSRAHALNSSEDCESMRPAMLKEAKRLGYETVDVGETFSLNPEFSQHYYGRNALYPGYLTGSQSGKAVAPLLGSIEGYGGGVADIGLGQVNFGVMYADHIVLYRFLPRSIQSTDMEIIWLVNQSAEQGKDYDLEELTWLWTVTTEADKQIILDNQHGVNSRFYEPGPLSDVENFLSSFNRWYLNQLRNLCKCPGETD